MSVSAASGVRLDGERPSDDGSGESGVVRGALSRSLGVLSATLEAERGRWFLWTPVLFGAGIGVYFVLPSEPAFAGLVALVTAVSVLWWLARNGRTALVAAALLTFAAGLCAAKARTLWVAAPVLEKPLSGVVVRGIVELIEPRPGHGERITLHVLALGDVPQEKRPVRARIRIAVSVPGLLPGDEIEFKARLSPPADPVLPGGFDFARAAWFQELGTVGFALQPPRVVAQSGASGQPVTWRAAIERLRRDIGRRVRAALPGETGAIATALITGERGGISEDTNDVFRNSGLLHILSISGLHMVVMAGAVFYGVRLGLALVPAIALVYPIKKWAAAIALVAAFFYLLMSGAAFATQRSYLMISILFTAVLLDRPAIAMRNVAVAALLMLGAYPESLIDAGFQMSFAAVIALVSAYESLRAWRAARGKAAPVLLMRPFFFLGGILLTTLVAGLAVAPFAAYHFHTSQQYALLANLIAIPICNLVVMPAAVITLVVMPLGLEAYPLWVMGEGIEGMLRCARLAAGLPGAVLHVAQIPFLAFGLMVFGGLWLALWQRPWRFFGVVVTALGVALIPFGGQVPDILIGRGGELVAVRTPAGTLEAVGGRSSQFELKRWLEHDGDGRAPSEASARKFFACDAAGCTAKMRAGLVAISKHPSSLGDDCAQSALLIATYPLPQGCRGPREMFDLYRLRNEGTHAITVAPDGGFKIETVAAARGERPWVRTPRPRPVDAAGTPARYRRDHGMDLKTGDLKTRDVTRNTRPRLAEMRPEVEDMPEEFEGLPQ